MLDEPAFSSWTALMLKNSQLLYGAEEINRRISELAGDLRPFCRQDGTLILWLKDGAEAFAREFCVALDCNTKSIGVKVSSYGSGRTSSGNVTVSEEIRTIRAKRVLLLDDILDSGNTAFAVCEALKSAGVEEIKTCFLVSKKKRREKALAADHVGFEIPDVFVYGFGLDLDGKLRELPEIRYIKE